MNDKQNASATDRVSLGLITGLTYLMFMMFAMTTDSVGVIIPKIIIEFKLSQLQAGAFHYATMSGIALAGLRLGILADTLGRKGAILLGLLMFGLTSLCFSQGQGFEPFLVLLFISGAGIGIFKTGALALISDISKSTQDHTKVMNRVEAFFGLGAIIGPFIVTQILLRGASWKWLYVGVGALAILLILMALMVKYPEKKAPSQALNLGHTLGLMKDPYALGFSALAMLYVGVETAIYVWMPTLLLGYHGEAIWVATYALSVFFILRVIGRVLGSFLLSFMTWTSVLSLCSGLIFLCFAAAIWGYLNQELTLAVYALPISGLFMSVIYPTVNSKGISCFPKHQHGAVGGVILFFTCLSAVLAPLIMGALSDHFGAAIFGFYFATALALGLFLALGFNALKDPAGSRLRALDRSEYDEAP